MERDQRMTLERLATMVADGFAHAREDLRREVGRLDARMDSIETKMDAKFLGVHNRLDDLAWNRASRDELAATNARVTRIEGHLGLA